ncbi:unnamed protein product [Auanema sp. JU1783]|nr:unnamed protein product [Auanema sp. JU1783]
MQLFIFSVIVYQIVAESCTLRPILRGVHIKQDLGSNRKKVFPNEPNCKEKCKSETDFECTAIVWSLEDDSGDCYLLDNVNLDGEIFVDNRPYILYVDVCGDDAPPSVGYCQYLLTQQNVEKTTSNSISPGSTSQLSCHEFCISNYGGRVCNAYIVSDTWSSTCTLYSVVPEGLATGTQNLWTKKCAAPPRNCVYNKWTEWSTCSQNCGGVRTRSRTIKQQPSEDGVQCLDSEMNETQDCDADSCSEICVYSDWTAFSACNSTCTENGIRSRSRTLQNGDSGSCSELTENQTCEKLPSCSGNSCVFSQWTGWSECASDCYNKRSRSITAGDPDTCPDESLEESAECTGDSCEDDDGDYEDPDVDENEGCRIASIDPSSRPSTQGTKNVGTSSNCAAACHREKSFLCEAFITTGSGGVCILFAKIDSNVVQLVSSEYYLQDLKCAVNNNPNTGICRWTVVGNGVSPDFSIPDSYSSIGLTIDSKHCGQLCMMNHPIFQPTPCLSWAWNPEIPFTSSQHNCFMFNYDAESKATPGGSYILHKLVCDE